MFFGDVLFGEMSLGGGAKNPLQYFLMEHLKVVLAAKIWGWSNKFSDTCKKGLF